MFLSPRKPFAGCLLAAIFALWAAHARAAPEQDDEIFAEVGGDRISVREYKHTLNVESRNRFYHGTAPLEQITAFQKEIADKMISNRLLVQEAMRRAMTVDDAALEAPFNEQVNRALRSGQILDEGGSEWLALKDRVKERLLVGQLEADVRHTVAAPSEENLREYYGRYPEKFTEPDKHRLSDILLTIAPSAPPEAWTAAEEEARRIVERLRAGADFAELARLHSGDRYADDGGDMGYLHAGMLSKEVEAVVKRLKVGEITDPILLLEGIAIFRLDSRESGGLLEFARVHDRAKALWAADAAEDQWREFIERLRATTKIRVEEKYLMPTGENTGQPESTKKASSAATDSN